MSLDTSSCACDGNIIYQSGDTTLTFELTSQEPNCQDTPLDLSAATEILCLFPTLVSPPVELRLSDSEVTVTNGPLGQFSALMSQANALLLTLGLINVEVRTTIGGLVTVTQILGQLTVTASLFPGV